MRQVPQQQKQAVAIGAYAIIQRALGGGQLKRAHGGKRGGLLPEEKIRLSRLSSVIDAIFALHAEMEGRRWNANAACAVTRLKLRGLSQPQLSRSRHQKITF